MNELDTLKQRWQAATANGQLKHLMEQVKAVFEQAVEARAPRNRPPGKAGLIAEKGYYRLLYLEGEFSTQAFTHRGEEPQALPLPWETMAAIIMQMKDIPELQKEISTGIAAALDKDRRQS